MSWLKGNHSFKFGYESRRMSDNFFDIRAPQGDIGVNGIYTAGGSFGVPDFLLGDVDSVLFTTPTVVHNYVTGNSLYAQDTWRVRPNLTVTYGLRYELFSPLLNRQNELSNFSPDNGGEIITADPNASGWFNRALVHPDKNDFAPRLGFSYHPFERVVLRGGYGIFYQHTVRIGSESILALNPPAVISYSLSQLLGQQHAGIPASGWIPDRQVHLHRRGALPNSDSCSGSERAERIRAAVQLWAGNSTDEEHFSGHRLRRQSGQEK